MTNETPAERLGRLVRQRRKQHLKLTQADIQRRNGPSPATQRLIEGGKHVDFRDTTGDDYEAALEWEKGSFERVLRGDPPILWEDTDLKSKLQHPAFSAQIAEVAEHDDEAAELLREIIDAGGVNDANRGRANKLFDDMEIQRFPKLFDALSRAGKLEVAHFANEVYTDEQSAKATPAEASPIRPTSTPGDRDHDGPAGGSDGTEPPPGRGTRVTPRSRSQQAGVDEDRDRGEGA